MKQYGIILEIPGVFLHHISEKYNLGKKNAIDYIIEKHSNIKIDPVKDNYRVCIEDKFEIDFIWAKIISGNPIDGLMEIPLGAYFPHKSIFMGELA